MTMHRYVFEEAERLLTAYCLSPERPLQHQRVFRKLLSYMGVVAQIDFPGMDSRTAHSHVWEDFQIACVGHGDGAMHGFVLDLWCTLPEEEVPGFRKALIRAFDCAEAATPDSVPRRYPEYHRSKPILEQEDFDYDPLVPEDATRIAEFEHDHGVQLDASYDDCLDPQTPMEELASMLKNEKPDPEPGTKVFIPEAPLGGFNKASYDDYGPNTKTFMPMNK